MLERDAIIVDPMLATGGSATAAIGFLKDRGIRNIKLMCIIAAPEGVCKLYKKLTMMLIFIRLQWILT
jgi:uracil phosphoribosyltransferase